ncbi:hypothetical protein J4434_04370 [Candidatus Woesearchaeota archaeon]|nr:hypothetical protein [Candidatus Woesearchaeota archaeon]
MAGKAYLGIDESNHGRFPEIYVGVYSQFPQDIKESTEILPKRRNNGNVFSELGGRQFKHLLIPEDYKIIYGPHNIRLIAYSELIAGFSGENVGDLERVILERVIIDGPLREEDLRKLRQFVSSTPHINSDAQNDTKFEIVNLADRVANLLHRYYTSSKSDSSLYVPYLITPDLRKYDKLLVK